MRVHLVNPSDISFGVGVITPRWLYVLASATLDSYGPPAVIDETLERFDETSVSKGDVVGIGIHTANAHRGYEAGRRARESGAYVVYGGIHATLYPDEARDHGQGHAVVRGDGDLIVKSLKSKIAFTLVSKMYRQMYANTGIATDSARHARAGRMARVLAKASRRLFVSPPFEALEPRA